MQVDNPAMVDNSNGVLQSIIVDDDDEFVDINESWCTTVASSCVLLNRFIQRSTASNEYIFDICYLPFVSLLYAVCCMLYAVCCMGIYIYIYIYWIREGIRRASLWCWLGTSFRHWLKTRTGIIVLRSMYHSFTSKSVLFSSSIGFHVDNEIKSKYRYQKPKTPNIWWSNHRRRTTNVANYILVYISINPSHQVPFIFVNHHKLDWPWRRSPTQYRFLLPLS